MIRKLLHGALAAVLLLALASFATAQRGKGKGKDKDKPAPAEGEKAKDPEDYRRFFRKPETVLEFWNALQFEIDVGKYDLAARHLRGLMDKKPTADELFEIQEKDGITPVLKLRTIRKWSSDKKVNDQATRDAADLVREITQAVRKKLADPDRIKANIRKLSATPEERDFALRDLYRSGAAVIPHLLDALSHATEARERLPLLQGLRRLGPETVPPLLAALDSDDSTLKLDILDILRARHVRQADKIVPHLWFLSASTAQPRSVRKKATKILSDFLDLPAARLRPARVALTRQAELYYRHKADLGDPRAVVVWRWDGKTVVQGWPGAPTVTATQAEEYWGLRYARQALQLDPAYRPAQVVFLSLALDKAMDRGGPTEPLAKTERKVHDLLSKANFELVSSVLERAMKERRTGVVLACTRSLGERAAVRAKRPTGRGEPTLVKLLEYPDRRVQLAAAYALLGIPGTPTPRTTTRIVEILARSLTSDAAAEGKRRILVALGDEGWRDRVAETVRAIGNKAVPVATGRAALREVRAADVNAILLESTLPLPGLASLLAQLRADKDAAPIPVLLAAVPETRTARDLVARMRKARARLDAINRRTRNYRMVLRSLEAEHAAAAREIKTNKRLGADDRVKALRTLDVRYEEDISFTDRRYPEAKLLYKDVPRIQREMDRINAAYVREVLVREEQLTRFVARYRNVWVVPLEVFADPRGLGEALALRLGESAVALTPAEQKQFAEKAIATLARLAEGSPAGYDVRPAAGVILAALRSTTLSKDGQKAAVRAAGRLPGEKAQSELASVVLASGRDIEVRREAASALIRHIQKYRLALTGTQIKPLRTLAGEAKLDATLKARLAVLQGSLSRSARRTGERLRDFKPDPPAGVLPPPKE
jgi:hypothetical protein